MAKKIKSPEPLAATTKKTTFPVVGIGASAGGLQALEAFFSNMPADTGMAFVIIHHFPKTRKSHLDNLLKRDTKMNIFEINDGMPIKKDHIYYNPSDRLVSILHGKFHLIKPIEYKGLRFPIDSFFRYLSEDAKEMSNCIVLSGTGSDGSLGLKAIKAAGGMVIVQDTKTAQYDGMPKSAIDTGLADFVLPVEEMVKTLTWYVKQHKIIKGRFIRGTERARFQDCLDKIFILLRSNFGRDFTVYKSEFIMRRVKRLITISEIKSIDEYFDYLQKSPNALLALYNEFSIGTTGFFRDKDAFSALKDRVIPDLFKEKDPDSSVRIWIAGCATGEEAYSIAILVMEYLDSFEKNFKVKIFATDIDKNALAFARTGVYPESISLDIPESRLERFFNAHKGGFQIKKVIREMVLFADHDVLSDPPFSKIDLISCRNLIIYLNNDSKTMLMDMFHYALNQSAFLFLGSCEGIVPFNDLFLVFDRIHRIFRRKESSKAKGFLYRNSYFKDDVNARLEGETQKTEKDKLIKEETERIILDEDYHHPYIVINEKHDVIYIKGANDKYLRFPDGVKSANIFKIIIESLQFELKKIVYKAEKELKDVTSKGLRFKHNGLMHTVTLIAKPILKPPYFKGSSIIIFEDTEPGENLVFMTNKDFDGLQNPYTEQLEDEVRGLKAQLQSAIEESEKANSERDDIFGKLSSAKEELHATIEELETSREELQADNEELILMNAELNKKVEELDNVNNDIHNLLSSTDVGAVFLDNDLCIKFFTSSITRIYNIVDKDTGRPLSDISANIKYDNIYNDIKYVLDTLISKEVEIETKDGKWFFMRILPYRTIENIVQGAVITFTDVSRHKYTEQLNTTILYTAFDGFLVFDTKGSILEVSDAYCLMVGYTRNVLLKMNICGIYVDESPEEFKAHIKRIIKMGGDVFDSRHKRKDDSIVNVGMKVRYLDVKGGRFYAIMRNITDKIDVKNELEKYRTNFEGLIKEQTAGLTRVNKLLENKSLMQETILNSIQSIVYIKDTNLKHIYVNKYFARFLSMSVDSIIGKSDSELFPEDIAKHFMDSDKKVLKTGKQISHIEEQIMGPDGKQIRIFTSKGPYKDMDGKVKGIVGISYDITKLQAR